MIIRTLRVLRISLLQAGSALGKGLEQAWDTANKEYANFSQKGFSEIANSSSIGKTSLHFLEKIFYIKLVTQAGSVSRRNNAPNDDGRQRPLNLRARASVKGIGNINGFFRIRLPARVQVLEPRRQSVAG